MSNLMRYFIKSMTYGLALSFLHLGVASAQVKHNGSFGVIPDLYSSSSQDITSLITLTDALKAAYAANPRIEAARQQFSISETDVSLAESGRRLSIEANASYGYLEQDNNFTTAQSSTLSGDTSDVGISLRQPIFRGFQTRNSILRATSISSASYVEIAAIEQQVFLEVVTAYLDVQRDYNVLNLNLKNLKTLNNQLKANEKRYELKDTSLTDVARSQSAVASAQSQIANARASYASARSRFFRLTGLSSENLSPLTSEPLVPESLEALMDKAISNNASINAARHALEASEYAVKEAKGDVCQLWILTLLLIAVMALKTLDYSQIIV